MTRRALIGHTGFVGSNLAAAGAYSDVYNSKSIEDIRGQRFDEIVCAGVSAVKWLANREPEKDWAGIDRLLDCLRTVEADRFVLISTIDVYPDSSQPLDEDADLAGLENHAYGRHRLAIEDFVRERFTNHSIVRLPALFGPGLRKNALFDLLNDNNTSAINPAGVFQWYPVVRLASDLDEVRRGGLSLVNLFPEPIAMTEIIEREFPDVPVGEPTMPAPRYDLRTRHAERFGGSNGYLMDRKAVLDAIRAYVGSARAARSA